VGNKPSFKSRKRFTPSELFSGFLAPDKLEDYNRDPAASIFRRTQARCKDYWQVERHPKMIAAPVLFEKSWNKNAPARLYVDECNRL
jgi:hypothetical protein